MPSRRGPPSVPLWTADNCPHVTPWAWLAEHGIGAAHAQLLAPPEGLADLGEDVIVEAEKFVAAWRDLPKLRERAAFPGWLRRIVQHRCSRLARHWRAQPYENYVAITCVVP